MPRKKITSQSNLSFTKYDFVESESTENTFKVNDPVWRKGTTFKCLITESLPGNKYKLYDEETCKYQTKIFRANQLVLREYYDY